MAGNVKWTKRGERNFLETIAYLEENFSPQTASNFVKKVVEKIEVLHRYPTIGRKVPKRKTVRFILLGKHRRLYYRVHGKEIIISNIFDTRQHPDKDIHQ